MSRRLAVMLGAAVLAAIALLTSFGYRAVREWRRSAGELARRRATDTANLLLTAFTRDMRAVQQSVLISFDTDDRYDLPAIAAAAFARYPYPESFFAFRTGDRAIVFLDRAGRRPAFADPDSQKTRFPVVRATHGKLERAIREQVANASRERLRFSAFEIVEGGVPYQIVTRLSYRDSSRQELASFAGFTVNLEWTRRNYFRELAGQVARISDAANGLLLQVVDERGRLVASLPEGVPREPAVSRAFGLQFFDPTVVAPPGIARRWRITISASGDAMLATARRAGGVSLAIVSAAALALLGAVVLGFRAMRSSARLAELRTEFVSSVTHELKTPVASIRALGDTLARDRVSTPGARAEYAQMIVRETKRLGRLIDNLLAYSRLTDVTEVYAFEDLDLHALVEDVLQGFSAQLAEKQIEVDVQMRADLARVRGDRNALHLMLDNLADNAIRYSADGTRITVAVTADQERCAISVTDAGIGIPEDEIERVMRRFHRGSNARPGGSGLGLAIVHRIVRDHGGALSIRSVLGAGTTVEVTIPGGSA